MKKLIYILLIHLASITYSYAQWPATDPSYQIVFGDEFNDTTGYMGCNIDTSKWVGRRPWNVDSTQVTIEYYSPHEFVTYDIAAFNLNIRDTSNIHVVPSTGTCRLIAREGAFVSHYWTWPGNVFTATLDTFLYSNGALTSRKQFRFGYFEFRFRLPGNFTPSLDNNYVPTCWLFGANDSLNPPMHSEIDIFEIDGRDNRFTNSIYFKNNIHDDLFRDHEPNVTTVTGGVWHTAAVDWSKEHIDFYYDGSFIRRETDHADSLDVMAAFIEAYVPNMWSRRNINANTVFPYVYEIDYYRVYQQKEACDTSKTYTSATVATFNSKVYENLTLSTNCYFNNGNASALGSEWVLLDAGTTIDSNMDMYINVVPCSNPVITPAISISPPMDESTFRKTKIK